MVFDIEQINHAVRNYAEDVRRDFPVAKAFLYGPYAKGNASELSDIDVCFFIENLNNNARVDAIVKLLEIGGKYKGMFFEPLAFPVSSLYDDNPFVKEVVRTGVEI